MKATKPVRVLPPEGQHIARVTNIIYLGTIKTQFGDTFKMRITFELPTALHEFKEGEGEKPFTVSKETSLSMGKKSTLRPLVEGIIGTSLDDDEAYAFDLDQLLGMTCQLHVVHEETDNGKYANIKSASPLLKGVTCPDAINPLKILSYEKWDQEYFDKLPDFLKEKMKTSPEYKKVNKGKVKDDDEVDSDSIPF
jgi:hypothetical protein